MTEPDIDLADRFMSTLLGGAEGWLFLAYKDAEAAGGRNERLRQKYFRYPDDFEAALAWIEDMAPRHPIYWCPLLRKTRRRLRGNAAIRRLLWLDLDGPADDEQLLQQLQPIVINSGRPGHRHLYVPLRQALSDERWHAQARGLRDAVGGKADNKIADNDLLRLPGTLNFRTTPPTLVTVEAGERKVWRGSALRSLVRPVHAAPSVDTADAVPGAEPVNWKRLPDAVRAAFDDDETGEGSGRYRRTFRLVAACRDSRIAGKPITLGQAITIASEYPPAIDKFRSREGGVAAEVVRCWNALNHKEAKVKKKRADDDSPFELTERRTSWTLDDLLEEEFPELRWIIPDLIPEGLTLVVAAPKVGKSYLMTNISLALTHALNVLGSIETEPCDVLLIPLDDPSPRRMQTRIKEIMTAMPPGSRKRFQLHIELDWPTLAEGGAERLDEWLTVHPDCRLVIIDTLSRLRDDDARKSADPGKPDEKAMATFKGLADKHRVAILGTHHDRKNDASDDYLNMVAGNKKLTGGADTIIYLTRARNQRHTTARITGRDVEEKEVALIFEHPLWVIADETPAELDMSDTRQIISTWLRENGPHGLKEIAKGTELDYDVVKNQCSKMAARGQLAKPSRGQYDVPKSDSRAGAPAHVDHRDNRYNVTNTDNLKVTRNGCNADSAGPRSRESDLRPATKKTIDFGWG